MAPIDLGNIDLGNIDLGDYVSGGYILCRPAARDERMNASLLPDQIVTVSDCIVEVAPNVWSIAWAQVSEAERARRGGQFGLAGSALSDFITWCTEAFDAGLLGWPHVIFDLDVARGLRERLRTGAEAPRILGIALPRDLVERFARDAHETGSGEPGVLTALRRGTPPPEGGVTLGFDVLGWDWGAFHSYICNGLETEFASALGIRPNANGFFDDLDDARQCADHANLATTGAEPGLWLPWLTVAYDVVVTEPPADPM